VNSEKFKTVGTEGLLTRVKNHATEFNKSIFQAELETQINQDETFANKLTELVKQLQFYQKIIQVILSSIKSSDGLEAEDINQKFTQNGSVE